ncbi:hypothetical protein [uncultured Winogradskyella sp.]|uniref:hypothetical protein n=1 Tax=uncultured Winogradskyella sp. TaxID=395353 RepID=UPI002624ED8E|nr:hypothetical protein [uncultured Winogradskyella sp.]
MIKRLIVVYLLFASFMTFAQQGTSSPYSFYGIGSLKFKGTVENRSMGGISTYLDSIHVNLRNPASYAGESLKGIAFEGESRPVKFTLAGTTSNVNLKGTSADAQVNTSTFDYLALSIPVGKFGFGFGLLPFSSVGYRLDDINDNDDLVNRFSGEGGVNKAFVGFGYQISNTLSAGVDVNYNFGNIQNTAIAFAYTPEGDLVQYQTRENNRSDLSGLNFNFGLAYKKMVTKNLELSATATYAPESTLTSQNQRSFSTILINVQNDVETEINTIEAGIEEKSDINLPSRLSFGAGLGKPKSWFVGAEYTFQNTSSFSNPVLDNDISTFENASQIAVGGFYIPKYDAFSGYFNRVVYRAGFNFANTGLVIKDESINEFGISFGLGLPVGNRSLFSNANIGFEYGQRGTTNQNLIQENFINLNLSLSLNSRWFRQRKYN